MRYAFTLVEGLKVNHAKDNGLTVNNKQPAKTYKQDTNSAIVTTPENLGKPFANLHARCALARIVLSAIKNDHGKTVHIVSRWNMTLELKDLKSVSMWPKKVTGGRP